MVWDNEAFVARVKARCKALGRSVRSVLIEADLSLDTLDKRPASGRKIDTIAKLCEPLQWTLAELMGFPASMRVNLDLMVVACRAARRALRNVPDPEEDEPLAVTIAYNSLLDHLELGGTIDENSRAMLEAVIGVQLGFARQGRK